MTDPIPEPLTAADALARYGQHDIACERRMEHNLPCNCGFLSALRAAHARQDTPASGGLDVDVLAQELDKHFEGDHRLNADHAVCARNIAKRYAARLTRD